MPEPLTDTEIEAALRELPEWRLDGGALRRDLRFEGFVEAFGFIARVALLAEKSGHHPEIRNVYRDVTVRLQTHDAGDRVTQRDVEVAVAIEGTIRS